MHWASGSADTILIGSVIRVLSQALQAVGHLHHHGVVHADVKPANPPTGTGTCAPSRMTFEFRDVVRVLIRWLRQTSPNCAKPFPFTSVCVNSGFSAKLHRDGSSVGPSLLRALGSVEAGGRLRYFPEDTGALPLTEDSFKDVVVHDPMQSWILMNGKHAHSVEEFEGTRFSVVFYTNSRWQPGAKATFLKSLGFEWPSPCALPYFEGYEACLASKAFLAERPPAIPDDEIKKKHPRSDYSPRRAMMRFSICA